MGKRLKIIELGKYIEVGELLIGNRITGSKAQVTYWDEDRIVSVAQAAVRMGVEGTGVHTNRV